MRPLAARYGADAHRRRARRVSRRCSTSTRSTAICLSTTVPPLVREWERARRALGGVAARSSSTRGSRPGSRSATTTRRKSARPHRQRRRRVRPLRRAVDRRRLRHGHEFEWCRRGRVPGRRVLPRHRDLDGRALRRAAGWPGIDFVSRDGDREDHGGAVSSPASSTASPARSTGSCSGSAPSSTCPRRRRLRPGAGRGDRPAYPDDRPRRSVPHARGPADRVGA